MKRNLFTSIFIFIISFDCLKASFCDYAQITNPNIAVTGFTRMNGYFDSRQVVGYGNVDLLLFPLEYDPDVYGTDINAHSQFDMVAIETNCRLTASGARVFNADALGMFEFYFFGLAENIAGMPEMRHGIVQLNWEDGSFLAGQYWHPLSPEDCLPEVLGYNGGSPMAVFNFSTQTKLVKKFNESYELMFAASSQRYLPSNGPVGPSTVYARNGVVPELTAQFRKYFDESLIGLVMDYKRLCPRLVTNLNYKTDEYVNGYIATAYSKYVTDNFKLLTFLSYVNNGNFPYLFGGYAVRSIDPLTDTRTYIGINDVSFWADMSYKYKCYAPGLFFGVIKNLGTHHPVYIDPATNGPITYCVVGGDGLDYSNIDYVARVSPRLWVDLKPLKLGFEFEITAAAYGQLDRYVQTQCNKTVVNYRLMGAIYYVF